jgi:hypothetical protein
MPGSLIRLPTGAVLGLTLSWAQSDSVASPRGILATKTNAANMERQEQVTNPMVWSRLLLSLSLELALPGVMTRPYFALRLLIPYRLNIDT